MVPFFPLACPSGNVQVLLNPEAQVPQSVIGTPGKSWSTLDYLIFLF